MKFTTIAALAVAGVVFQPAPQPLPSGQVTSIELRVGVGGNRPARMRVRSGQRATVTPFGEPTIDITPFLKDSVVEVVLGVSGSDRASWQRFEMAWGGDAVSAAVGGRVVNIQWTAVLDDGQMAEEPDGPCTQCCVICDGVLACACVVQTACGDCCCPTACRCPQVGPVTTGVRSAPVGGRRHLR